MATSVDHVLPLIRGGSNFEGNLVPCCRSCNGSKAGLFVSEWRHGLRCSRNTGPAHPLNLRSAKALQWADPLPLALCACGALTDRPKWCADCAGSPMRKNRVENGIPLDLPYHFNRQGSPICTVENCDRPSRSREMCRQHYRAWVRRRINEFIQHHALSALPEPITHKDGTCGIDGCNRPHSARGRCEHHYKQACRDDRGRVARQHGFTPRWEPDNIAA